ncbi:MAG: exodeoxyribonuclease VII large subunit [Caulobacterales bacterium]
MPDSATAPVSNLPELSVSELSSAVKRTMETTFDRVRVRGELGRVTVAKSGHLYADLKDANAVLSLVMWKGTLAGVKFRPEEGLEVVAEGRLSTFPGKSSYQLIADRLEPAGVGALLAQLERLKTKLAAEGLFAPERKKAIPFLPQTIGVITSPTGAVIRDILHRLGERFPRRVILWPVLVQGDQAAGQVAAAIRGFNALTGELRPDVLIVARGGGSIEDLWAFNEEIVVRAAAESVIPLISAVGHETDTTLIDFASDLRAPTPTGAAEKAVPVRAELIARIETLSGRLVSGFARGLDIRRTEVRAAGGRLPRPQALLEGPQQRFDRASERLASALIANVRAHKGRLDAAAAALRPAALRQDIERRQERLAALTDRQRLAVVGGLRARAARLEALSLRPGGLMQDLARRQERLRTTVARLAPALERGFGERVTRLAAAGRLLDSLSHKSALQRGFALVRRPDGGLVRAATGLEIGEAVTLVFHDGEASAAITGSTPAGAGGGSGPKKRRKGEDGGDQGALF